MGLDAKCEWEFSSKSTYLTTNKLRFSALLDIPRAFWLRLWGHKFILPCHKLLWWQNLSNAIPTRDKLNSLFYVDDVLCPVYMTANETVIHLLFFFLVIFLGFSG